ncbi:MAG: hypothetical protein QOI01_267 [Mycobacterium sp.]|jgi:hypothetical protein|nr:hypothetical protein [Mycobacterium sp.]
MKVPRFHAGVVPWIVPNSPDVLAETRDLIAAHTRPGMTTVIDGLPLSKTTTGPESPDYSLTEPLLVVVDQGGKRRPLGDQVHEYRSGQYLLVTANLPVTGHFFDTSAAKPALGMGLVLRRAAVADLVLQNPRWSRGTPRTTAMTTGDAAPDLLDAVLRYERVSLSPKLPCGYGHEPLTVSEADPSAGGALPCGVAVR